MIYVDGVAYRDTNVGRHLAPFFRDRLALYMADNRVAGRVWVVSGSRSFASQLWLWTKWNARARGFNMAANPYRTIGTCLWADPPFTAHGSWHMEQESANPKYRGAGAADLGWSIDTNVMQAVAKEYGLAFTVPGENWHCQAYNTAGIFPAATTTIDPPPTGGPIVSSFGNASFTQVYIDDDVIVLWHDLDGTTPYNFHIQNRKTSTDRAYAHGVATDRFGDVRRRNDTLMLTVRRGGNEYHTLPIPIP